jgi:hypothetical protein
LRTRAAGFGSLPLHNFKVAGYYNVTLTITDDLARSFTNVVAVDAGYVAVTTTVTIYLDGVTIYTRPFSIFGV